MRALVLTLSLGAGLLAAAPADAIPFGPASGSIVDLFSPVVTLGATSGSAVVNGPAFLFSTTGSLFGTVTGSGTSSGTVAFSKTVGTVVNETLNGLLTFADTTGGQFVFDASSVQTTGFSNNPGVSTSISLYVLGAIGDTNLGLTPTLTSVTLTMNQTGNSAFSASATLANPPAPIDPVPEPASMAVLGTGLLGLLAARRRA